LRPLGSPLTTVDAAWPLARFTPDGSRITGLAPTADGKQRWVDVPARPSAWVSLACQIARPPLSRSEWTRYVGDRPYRATC